MSYNIVSHFKRANVITPHPSPAQGWEDEMKKWPHTAETDMTNITVASHTSQIHFVKLN